MSLSRVSSEWTGARPALPADVTLAPAVTGLHTRSLRIRLITMVIAIMMPLAALATLRAVVQSLHQREVAENGLINSAVTLANALDREARETIALVQVAIAIGADTRDTQDDLKARLDAIAGVRPYFTLALSDRPAPPALRFTSPLLVQGPNAPALGIEIPTRRPGQAPIAVLITFSQAHLQQFLMDHALPARSILAIIDSRGHVVARNLRPEAFVGTTVIAPVREGLAHQDSGLVRTANVEGIESSIAFARAPLTGFATALSLPSAQFLDEAWRSAETMLAYALAAMLVATAVALLMASRISRKLRLVAADLTAGRMPRTGFAEIAELASAFRSAEDQRNRSIATLKDQEHYLHAILDALPLSVMVLDTAFVAQFANRRARDEAAGAAWETAEQRNAYYHPDDLPLIKDFRRRWLRDGTSKQVEVRYLVGGTYRWHRFDGVSLQPYSDAPANFMVIATDVHEAHEAAEELARLNMELEARVAERTTALTSAAAQLTDELSHQEALRRQLAVSQKREALGQLTAGIAHDINNILAVITNSFCVIEHATSGSEIDQSLALGRTAARHAAALLHNLTAFTQARPAMPGTIDIAVVLPEIVSLCRHSVDPAYTVTLEILATLPSVPLDAELLQAALLNLVTNACQSMPKGGTIRVRADVVACRCDGHVASGLEERTCLCLSVSDTGVGMSDEQIAHATEAFYTTRAAQGGSGLGLAMVDGFVRQSGGRMQIISAPGLGTTITLFLPRLPHEPGEAAAVPKAPPLAELETQRTILVVDDNRALLHSSSLLLRTLGFTVLEADSGPTAMALAEQHPDIDLVLSDIAMPGETGTELAPRLRALRPRLPIIFLTGYAGSNQVTAEHLVLSKPIAIEQLLTAINDALALAGDLPGRDVLF